MSFHRTRCALCTVVALSLATTLMLAGPASAQSRNSRDGQDNRRDAFDWTGVIASGSSIIIRNINGPIRVERSGSGQVEVSAEKRWRRGDPADVRIVQPRTGTSTGDVVICALWSEESTCDAQGIHTPRNSRNNNRNNDVSVSFIVRVPNGVHVDIATVNGGLEVSGVDTEVRAETVNGSIEARSSGGPVQAKTVNGSITVGMGNLTTSHDLRYETVNGSITLELPSTFGAQLELSTVNGRVNTDFPVTVVGTLSTRKLRGTVGNGSARVRATTVNGGIRLVRSN
ncbi:MAG: DUF4097 family beta strand repeat-containing protein [Gemmatimonadaceae bacterium]